MLKALGVLVLLVPCSASYDPFFVNKSSGYTTPLWTPTYLQNSSTLVMPCNYSGYFNTSITSKFGIVDYDWSSNKMGWVNAKPMNCEESLIEQARMTKATNPATKVFVYRNLVKALPWYTSVYTKLADPQYSGWFLKFSGKNDYHVPQCDNTYSPPLCSDL